MAPAKLPNKPKKPDPKPYLRNLLKVLFLPGEKPETLSSQRLHFTSGKERTAFSYANGVEVQGGV